MSFHFEQYGLSKNEAAVYAASLELGPATADQLAKHSGVKRSTTYLQIEALQEMGLMSSYEEGRKTLFTPESPENLSRLIDRQKAELDLRQKELGQQLPELIRSFESAGERPVVRFYQGKEGIVSVREEMLRVKNKETFVIFAADEMETLFTDEERNEYTLRRDKLGIKLNLLYSRKSGPFQSEAPSTTNRKYLGKEIDDFFTDIIIYDNKVAFFSMKGETFCVVIENQNVSESLKTLFKLIWNCK